MTAVRDNPALHRFELEVDGVVEPGKEQAAKRRLELLMEEKRAKRDLEDFDDYDV